MAARAPNEPHIRPELGDTLLVIHEFQARSSDELSFVKGDRVELIERDDEFGDGWYLGRHLGNGNTGLFPQLYTRPIPKAVAAPIHPPSAPPATHPELAQPTSEDIPTESRSDETTSVQPILWEPPILKATSTLQSNQPELVASATTRQSTTDDVAREGSTKSGQDSQVLHDTLNVINEHITNLRSPASNNAAHNLTNDSGSEYSLPLASRMSYIHGEETDEEEGSGHTASEVAAWMPDDVAEFLFTSGVEKHHCEVFKDQEISGEVLLGMDQSSLFIKALDLGSVGRRLKTWHKIKALQDQVNSHGVATRRTTQTYGSDVGSDEIARTRGRTSTVTSISNPPASQHNYQVSAPHSPPSLTPVSSAAQSYHSPTHLGHQKRPSAASVRDMNHLRRHSSTEQQLMNSTPRLGNNARFPGLGPHKKQPSFDRNWSLGGAFAQNSSRPLSSSGSQLAGMTAAPDAGNQDSAVDLDRGYFSGTEVDGRIRAVARKRDSVAHSTTSSYADEQRVRSATAISRHSRLGSDSYRESVTSSSGQKYYGVQPTGHRRTVSTNTTNTTTTESTRPTPPAKDGLPPTVTRLETSRGSLRSSKGPPTPAKDGDWLSALVNKPKSKSGAFGLRAISDNLGFDKSKPSTSAGESAKDQPLPSPARTTSSTPSGGQSLDLETSSTTKVNNAAANAASRNKGKKGKKETSAYTRGLLKIGPQEAMKDADYCGWMRKKSSHLMTTWKPRFFVLKGRRLSYYYSEDDTEEKGLIDISFHRVLPADNEKLTGLHATLTGVVGGQDSKLGNLMPMTGEVDTLEKGDDTVFIFKLVPPRSGLSRAVNFTKPTVHYFAVPNLKQGRLWMAALMKATIDRDDSQPITTTYQAKTISLAKAKQMRHRPPALMNLEEAVEEDSKRNDEQILGEPSPLSEDGNMDLPDPDTEALKTPGSHQQTFEDSVKLSPPSHPST